MLLEAIYENGVLKPLQEPNLKEHQRVLLEIRGEPPSDASTVLRDWQRVYEGLSEDEIAAVEAIALDRDHFLREGK